MNQSLAFAVLLIGGLAAVGGCSDEAAPRTQAVEPAAASAQPPAEEPAVASGFATPQEAATAFDDAIVGADWSQLWRVIDPEQRRRIVPPVLDAAGMVAIRSDQGRASYERILGRHGLDLTTGPRQPSPGEMARQQPGTDHETLFVDVMQWLAQHVGDGERPSSVARVDDLVIEGDEASGTLVLDGSTSYPLRFRRDAEGRWFVHPAAGDLLDLVDGRLGWRL